MPLAAGLYFHLMQDGIVETPPVVLIHGAGEVHLFWPPQIRRIPGYRVFALDLPGHGKSGQGGGMQSIDSYADQVLTWMQAVQLHRAVFVGHGMGGAIALSLAIRHPERVLGLGLISTGLRVPVPPDLLADSASPTTFYKAVKNIVSRSFGTCPVEQQVELLASRLSEVRPSVLYGDLLACDRFDCTGYLANIRLPTLVICGTEDRVTPLRYSQLMAQVIPGAILEEISQAGHMVMLEQPDRVAKPLVDFLKLIPYHAGEVNLHVPGN